MKKYEVMIQIRKSGKIYKKGELIQLSAEEAQNFIKDEVVVEFDESKKSENLYKSQEDLKIKNETLIERNVYLEERLKELETGSESQEVSDQNAKIVDFFMERDNLLRMDKSLISDFAELCTVDLNGETKEERVDSLLKNLIEE